MKTSIIIIIIFAVLFMINYEQKEHFEKDPIVKNFKYFDRMLLNATNSIRKFNRDMFRKFYNYKKKNK